MSRRRCRAGGRGGRRPAGSCPRTLARRAASSGATRAPGLDRSGRWSSTTRPRRGPPGGGARARLPRHGLEPGRRARGHHRPCRPRTGAGSTPTSWMRRGGRAPVRHRLLVPDRPASAVASDHWYRARLLYNRLVHGRTDGALVRIASPAGERREWRGRPRPSSRLPPGVLPGAAPEPAPLDRGSEGITRMTKPKLLVVDDDESIRTQVKYALRDDYTLWFAEDRAQAMALLPRGAAGHREPRPGPAPRRRWRRGGPQDPRRDPPRAPPPPRSWW